MPTIELRGHSGDITGRLSQIARALAAACAQTELPGLDRQIVTVSDGGAALLNDARCLVVDVRWLELIHPQSGYVPQLGDALAKAAGALLDPEWRAMVFMGLGEAASRLVAQSKGSFVRTPSIGTQ